MTDLYELSAQELSVAYRAGQTDPVELTQCLLDRAELMNNQLGAFAHITRDYALAQARTARKALGQGDPRPLLGVPCPIKDLTQVAGLPFEAGSRAFVGQIAAHDAGIVQRLHAAGTITLGKTTTPEFGMTAYTEPATGTAARSPWDPRRTAGGSSGGAAVAVSAALAPVAHGSDGGGSIRIPASCCGVVGLKPSRGRISPGPLGVAGNGLVSDGILARTVYDIAMLLTAMTNNLPGDSFVIQAPHKSFECALATQEESLAHLEINGIPHHQLRIAVLTQPLICHDLVVHPQAIRAVERAACLLAQAGCHIDAAPIPFEPEDWAAFEPVWSVGAASIPLPESGYEQLMPLTRWLIDRGRECTATGYANALNALQSLAARTAAAWQDFDAILSPVLSGPPEFPEKLQLPDPQADFQAQSRFTPWASTWNILGAPAISVPLHRARVDDVELPFGIQLGATRLGDEELLLRLARVLELLEPWPQLAPSCR